MGQTQSIFVAGSKVFRSYSFH